MLITTKTYKPWALHTTDLERDLPPPFPNVLRHGLEVYPHDEVRRKDYIETALGYWYRGVEETFGYDYRCELDIVRTVAAIRDANPSPSIRSNLEDIVILMIGVQVPSDWRGMIGFYCGDFLEFFGKVLSGEIPDGFNESGSRFVVQPHMREAIRSHSPLKPPTYPFTP